MQADVAQLMQTGLVRQVDPQMPLDWRLHQQLKSLHGGLKGLAAADALRTGQDSAPDFQDFLLRLPELLKTHHDEFAWRRDVEDRITAHGLGQW